MCGIVRIFIIWCIWIIGTWSIRWWRAILGRWILRWRGVIWSLSHLIVLFIFWNSIYSGLFNRLNSYWKRSCDVLVNIVERLSPISRVTTSSKRRIAIWTCSTIEWSICVILILDSDIIIFRLTIVKGIIISLNTLDVIILIRIWAKELIHPIITSSWRYVFQEFRIGRTWSKRWCGLLCIKGIFW